MTKKHRAARRALSSAEAPQPSSPSAPQPKAVIDEKLFRAYELYLSERTRLSTGKQVQSKAYDQTILTFSGGAVALSITFLEKVVKNPNAKEWLYVSWILFALAMLSTLYSLLASQKAFEGEIADVDVRYRQLVGLTSEDESTTPASVTPWGVSYRWLETFAHIFTPGRSVFRAAVKWLNRLAAAFFFFGVISFGWFALQNWVVLAQEKAPVATTKGPRDLTIRPTKPGTGSVPDPGVLPPIKQPPPPSKDRK